MSTFIEEREQRRELRTRANLEAMHNGDFSAGMIRDDDELSLGGGALAEVDRALATLDDDEPPMRAKGMSPKQRSIIAAGIIRNNELYEKDRSRVYAIQREKSRRKSRDLYAQQCAEEGRAVRPYTKHARIPGETPHERKTRLHREDTRRRRGKFDETVRTYENLDYLTEEERRDRVKQQNAASKRRQRAAQKQVPSSLSQKGAA